MVGVGVVGSRGWGGGGLGVVEVVGYLPHTSPTTHTSLLPSPPRRLPLDPTTLDGLFLY